MYEDFVKTREVIAEGKILNFMTANGWYEYFHSKKGNGKGISIVPYRTNNDQIEILVHCEINPAHGDGMQIASITGACEKDNPPYTAILELKEEGGYDITEEELHYLGSIRPSKASDTEIVLFVADLTGKEQGEALGDGGQHENLEYPKWVSLEEAILSKDPCIPAAIVRYTLESWKEDEEYKNFNIRLKECEDQIFGNN